MLDVSLTFAFCAFVTKRMLSTAISFPTRATLPLCMHTKLLQSCPTLSDPMDCSWPGSSVHRILQTRILEWLPFPSPGDLHSPGIETSSLSPPALEADSLPLEPAGKLTPLPDFKLKCLCSAHRATPRPCPPVNGCRKEEIHTSPPRGWPSQEIYCKIYGLFSLLPHLLPVSVL